MREFAASVRLLRQQPAFACAAVATLAIGLAATTAIFTAMNAVLLRPLPFPASTDLFAFSTAVTDGTATMGKISPLDLSFLVDPSSSVLTAAGSTRPVDGTLVLNDASSVPVTLYAVSSGFFDVFRLPMTAGRAFTPAEHATGQPQMAVLSHRLWRTVFGADPAIVGTRLRLLEGPVLVVGVAADDLAVPRDADMWLNLQWDSTSPRRGLDGYIRVRSGTTLERLREELEVVMGRLGREFPSLANNRVYKIEPLVTSVVGVLRPILVALMSAAALLLVMACVNVTNLFLARGAVRARDVALQLAIGAGRPRIVRQLLIESLVLAAVGAVIGGVLGQIGLRFLLSSGGSALPRLDAAGFDARVWLFAVAVPLVAAVVIGLIPALRLATVDVRKVLNEGSRTTSAPRGQRRLLAALVVSEIALAVMMMAGAGFLLQSFAKLQAIAPGFVAEGRLVFDIAVPSPFDPSTGPGKYGSAANLAVWGREVHDRVRAVPGVTAVGSAASIPLGPDYDRVTYLGFDDRPADPSRPLAAHLRRVSPTLFEALGVRLVAGRTFTVDDRQGTTRLAVVSQSFVDRYLTGREPIDSRFAIGYPVVDPKARLQIVGVVDDVRYASLTEEPEPTFYVPQDQDPYWRQTIVVATSLPDPTRALTSVVNAIKSIDPQLPIRAQSMTGLVATSLSRQQLGAYLMLVFAAGALTLMATGVYGVMSYVSAQRLDEVATRRALGATSAQVLWQSLRHGQAVAGIGLLLGVAGALLVGRVLAARFPGVSAADVVVLTAAIGLVLVVAIVSVLVPALRAARVEPSRILRNGRS